MYINFFKPLFDKLFASILLVLLSPLIFLIIILLFLLNRNDSIFFYQTRPGKNEKLFKIIKFKTMNDKRDNSGKLLPDDLRLTPFGKFLRSFSIDEVLQLINVLKGDMSIVGPRPLLVQYLTRYSAEQSRRHLVKPGITGWAQVNGRNELEWHKKFKLDNFYVENISFLLDIKIIFMTIKGVLKRSGVNQSENITMNEFLGNN